MSRSCRAVAAIVATGALAATNVVGSVLGIVAVSVGISAVAPSVAHADDGGIIDTFGLHGLAVDPIAGASGRTVLSFDVLDLPDGSLLVGGALMKLNGTGEQGFIVKYRSDGTRDTSFGIGGRAALPAGSTSEPLALATLPDGRIVIGGRFFGDKIPANGGLYLMAADGTSLGLIGNYAPTRDSTPTNRLVAQPDGSVLAIGRNIRMVLPSGQLDKTFDRDLPLFGYEGSLVASATRLFDGRIAILSTVDVRLEDVIKHRCSVAVFDRTGELDQSFGILGHVELTIGGVPPQSCAQILGEPTGSMLVVVGDPKSAKTATIRLDPSGNSLPGPAIALPAPTLGHEHDIEGNGRILAARPGIDPDTATVQAYRADGSVDPNFGGGEPIVVPSGGTRPQVHALQSGGIVVVAGQAPESIMLSRLDSRKGIAPQPAALPTTKLVPLPPIRFLDTRDGTGAPLSPVAAGHQIDLQIGGVNGVPNDARAVVMSVAATGSTGPGFVTAWPSGTNRPNVASLNIEFAGQTIANLVTVKLGTTGAVSLFTLGQTDLIADVQGYYVSSDSTSDGRFLPAAQPTRIVDTRIGLGSPAAIPANGEIGVQVAGVDPVPWSGVAAVALNVAATEVPSAGFLTVYPSGVPRPNVSSLNVDAGETRSNMVIVPIGPDGRISIYSYGGAHVIVDVAGWFTDSTAKPSLSGLYVPITPARILDTRLSGPAPLAPDTTFIRLIGGSLVAPPRGRTSAIVVNVTATEVTAPGYFTLWPHGMQRPVAANLNADSAGQTVPNAAIVPVRQEMIDGYTQSGAHVVIDLFGYYLS